MIEYGEGLVDVLRRLFSERRLLILGIGNILRGDDGIGVLVAKRLRRLVKGLKNVKVVVCESGLENMTYLVGLYRPTHILIIDAVYVVNGLPGDIYILKPEDLSNYQSVTTHHLPLKLIVDYMRSYVDAEVTIIGVQVKNIDLGSRLSDEVLKAYEYLINVFKEVISSGSVSKDLSN